MAFWAVARTLTRRESFAGERIEVAGFEIFVPKTARGPLFPGYLFVRIVDRWRVVDRTLGVLGLIKYGDSPAKCPDVEIAALRARADAAGIIRLEGAPATSQGFAAGAAVTISRGAFAGFNAVYAGQTSAERELILLSVLGGPRLVEIAAGQLAAQGD
jgi:transcriptional antiterminator RfaH